MPRLFICKHCGLYVGQWFFGWKHHASGSTRKSCGRKLTDTDVREL